MMHGSEHPRPDGSHWKEHGACKGKTAIFFPDVMGQASINLVRRAKAICAGCPVLVQCRSHAITEVGVNEPGVWGGITRDERRDAKRRRRIAMRKATA